MTPSLKKSKLIVLALLLTLIVGAGIWIARSQPPSLQEYGERAEQLKNQKDWAGLAKLATQWRSDYPQSSLSHVVLADALRMQKDYSGAAAAYSESLQRHPDHPQLWAYQGVMLLEMGQFAQAATSCQKSVGIAADHAEGWYCLALAQAELGQSAAAADALAKLQSLNPPLAANAKNVIVSYSCKKAGSPLTAQLCAAAPAK